MTARFRVDLFTREFKQIKPDGAIVPIGLCRLFHHGPIETVIDWAAETRRRCQYDRAVVYEWKLHSRIGGFEYGYWQWVTVLGSATPARRRRPKEPNFVLVGGAA